MIQKVWWENAVRFFIKASAWIAFPVIGALFLGRYLDARYNTKPFIFLGLTLLAFLISMVAIIRESTQYLKDVEKENKENKQNDRSKQSTKY